MCAKKKTLETDPLRFWCLQSGISKPRFCQTYVLQSGAFHENDRNHENDEDNSDSHKQGVWLLDSRKSREWRKPREPKVQNIGSPKPRFRKTRYTNKNLVILVQQAPPACNSQTTLRATYKQPPEDPCNARKHLTASSAVWKSASRTMSRTPGLVGPRFASANDFDLRESIRGIDSQENRSIYWSTMLFAIPSAIDSQTYLSREWSKRKGLRGAIRKKWVTRATRIDSRELFMIRANSVNDSRE